MTFVSAAFLFAALAGAIPVVLHMINRQQAKNLPFSTLRFLRISAEKTRRRKRIHDLLLMLLRVAVLILLALGLAEPTLTSLSHFWGNGSSAVAIILDNSASMGMIDEGRPRFETARDAARQILGELGDGDQVVLMLTGGPKLDDQERLQTAHDKVLQAIDQAAVSYERAELAEKLRDAENLLARTETQNKQIYVLTDMQQLSWEGLKERAQKPPDAEPADGPGEQVPVIVVDCNRNPKPNVAVTRLELKAVVPVAGLPITATVELFNAASAPQKRHAELYVDGARKATSPELEIPPGERLTHGFQFVLEQGGTHRGEVRIVGDDGSRYDDQRYFSLEVDQGIPVAIVKSREHEIAYLEDTFYLEQALAPARSGAWAIRTTSLTAGELQSEPLSNYRVIFCVNLEAPDPGAAQRLRAYVAGGGNLVWIAGDRVDPAAYNAMNEQAAGQLLPAPLAEVRLPNPSDGRDSWHIASLDETDPAMSQLAEPASLYQSVLIYKHLRMDTAAAAAAKVLARLDDGEAFLARAPVEKGNVIMVASGAHVGWSNLPVRPIFLPMMARLVFELAGAEQTRHRARAGSPLVVQLDDELRPVTVEVRPPSGAIVRKESQPMEGGGQKFTYPDTHDVGIYTLRLLDTARPSTIPYSVNLDPDEADSKTIARDELERQLTPAPVVFADDPEDLSSTFKKLREGESLWETLLAGVLIVLVFETLISNLLKPQKDEDQYKHLDPGFRRLARKGETASLAG
jgi:hypothetical protein